MVRPAGNWPVLRIGGAAFLILGLVSGPLPAQAPPTGDKPPAPAASQPANSSSPRPPMPSLEDMLIQALKSNPDAIIAEAKVREAEAELNRVRLQITRKLIEKYKTVEFQRRVVEEFEARVRN